MEIKSGRKIFTLTSKDRILFNGACYILITQKVRNGWHEISPTLTKSTIQKLIKKGDLVISKQKYKGIFGEVYDLYQMKECEDGEDSN